jgi:hypothetical protein
MKSKHKKAIVCLVESTEALLNAFEKHKINTDEVAKKPQFKVLVHLIKTIIDGETGVPNELNDRLNKLTDDLGLDNGPGHTVH